MVEHGQGVPPAKEQKTMVVTKTDEIQEKLAALENRIELLEIIAKKGTPEIQQETQREVQQETKKLIQINAKGKKYFCRNRQEQQLFKQNNPGVETEVFEVELAIPTADAYLDDPENKKQFAVIAKEELKESVQIRN